MGAGFMEQNSSRRRLDLAGALTIERASALKTELLAALAEPGALYVDISAIDDLDLSCLQVFYAARKQAVAVGKDFHFSGTVPGRIVKRLVASGFLRGSSERAEDFEASLTDF
jgi:anti-anti-sigma regulatory factor